MVSRRLSLILCNLFLQSKFLVGNQDRFNELQIALKEGKIPEKLERLRQEAIEHRMEQEKNILEGSEDRGNSVSNLSPVSAPQLQEPESALAAIAITPGPLRGGDTHHYCKTPKDDANPNSAQNTPLADAAAVPEEIEALIQLLHQQISRPPYPGYDTDVYADVLDKVGPSAIGPLIEAMKTADDEGVCVNFACALSYFGQKATAAVPVVVEAFKKSRKSGSRERLAWYLAKIVTKQSLEAVPVLGEALKETASSSMWESPFALWPPSHYKRLKIVHGLVNIGNDEAIKILDENYKTEQDRDVIEMTEHFLFGYVKSRCSWYFDRPSRLPRIGKLLSETVEDSSNHAALFLISAPEENRALFSTIVQCTETTEWIADTEGLDSHPDGRVHSPKPIWEIKHEEYADFPRYDHPGAFFRGVLSNTPSSQEGFVCLEPPHEY